MLSEYYFKNKEYFVPCGPNNGKQLMFSACDQMIGDSIERFNFMYENIYNKEDFMNIEKIKQIITRVIDNVIPNLSDLLIEINEIHYVKMEGKRF